MQMRCEKAKKFASLFSLKKTAKFIDRSLFRIRIRIALPALPSEIWLVEVFLSLLCQYQQVLCHTMSFGGSCSISVYIQRFFLICDAYSRLLILFFSQLLFDAGT
jgi:hypothetical protein